METLHDGLCCFCVSLEYKVLLESLNEFVVVYVPCFPFTPFSIPRKYLASKAILLYVIACFTVCILPSIPASSVD